ncbi:MAG: GNAT family N-acetyltransferase [Flavobacteriaceae bacterium]|nr:GNAT family N-acetyltransferase [Flavobacteriaceae bacterium]
MKEFLIKTERLGLRNWLPEDEAPFIEMCADAEVMKHFPTVLSSEETLGLINRLKNHFIEFGYTYFAAEVIETAEFIGFIGIANQTWESEYTPCVDIGWRLKQGAWGKGYATEGAKACLDAAKNKFGVSKVLAFATDTNHASEQVMQKIGMSYVGTVQHPKIKHDPRFKHCVVYST